MKVLLINPPYPFEESPTPPFGLMSLAAYLEKQGIEVKIDDYIITPCTDEAIRENLAAFRPDVIGATGVTMNVKKGLAILKKCREFMPSALTVMGGPHVTFDAEAVLSGNPFVDYIIRGEGELTFVELLDAIRSGSPADDIQGLSFRKNGTVAHNPARPFIEDINILPFPARHLVQISKYKALGFPINMVTSRGCPHKCIFCLGSKMVGRKVRYFDVNRVADEFEMLSKMKFKQINIVDDLFTSNKKRCIAFCEEIMRRGIKHPWTAFARVDTVSAELLSAMKSAGCTTLCFGIESASQEILNTVRKGITIEKCERAVALCRDAGIVAMTSYILGLPGETRDTMHHTISFAKKLSPDYGFHILAPFPGTEVRENKEHYGITILSDDWDLYDANRAVSVTGGVSDDEINRIADEFNGLVREKLLSISRKLAAGETVSEPERAMHQSIKSFIFTSDLILKRLVERYPGLNGGADGAALLSDFSHYVRNNTSHPEDDIRQEIDRLIRIESLRVDRADGLSTLNWT